MHSVSFLAILVLVLSTPCYAGDKSVNYRQWQSGSVSYPSTLTFSDSTNNSDSSSLSSSAQSSSEELYINGVRAKDLTDNITVSGMTVVNRFAEYPDFDSSVVPELEDDDSVYHVFAYGDATAAFQSSYNGFLVNYINSSTLEHLVNSSGFYFDFDPDQDYEFTYYYDNLYQAPLGTCDLQFTDRVDFSGIRAKSTTGFFGMDLVTTQDVVFGNTTVSGKTNITCVIQAIGDEVTSLTDYFSLRSCNDADSGDALEIEEAFVTFLDYDIIAIEFVKTVEDSSSSDTNANSDSNSASSASNSISSSDVVETESCWVILSSCGPSTYRGKNSNLKDVCLNCTNAHDNCRDCSAAACFSCDTGYYLQEGSCSQCEENCGDCISAQGCEHCLAHTGTFLVDGLCETCVDMCDTCRNSTSCEFCKDGYYLDTMDNSDAQACNSCIDNCQVCGDSETCDQCMTGYNVSTSQRACYVPACDIDDCVSCDTNNNICTGCVENTTLSTDGTMCKPVCDDENCDSCPNNGFTCEVCNLGYENVDGACELYEPDCPYGFMLEGDYCVQNTTMDCYVQGCDKCSASSMKTCSACMPGYTLESGSYLCSGDNLCIDSSCAPDCGAGFYFDYYSQYCTACDTQIYGAGNCTYDFTKMRVYAGSCQAGFTLTKGICEPTAFCDKGFALYGDITVDDEVCEECSKIPGMAGCGVCHINFEISETELLTNTSFSYTREFEYICQECNNGYAIETSNATCGQCANNCITCSEPANSNACIVEDCSVIPNCISCQNSKCEYCQSGYYADDNGQCTKCNLDNCALCSFDPNPPEGSSRTAKCDHCKVNYDWSETTGSCIPQTCTGNQNCIDCEGSVCHKCIWGFGVVDGNCVECTDGCTHCVNNQEFVATVETYDLIELNSDSSSSDGGNANSDSGSSQDSSMSSSSSNSMSNSNSMSTSQSDSTETSDEDLMSCYFCENGHYLERQKWQKKQDKELYICKDCGANCAICDYENEGQCSICNEGFFQLAGECHACTLSNCKECRNTVVTSNNEVNNVESCIECSNGNYMNIQTGKCEACASGCETCIGPNDDDCITCTEGKTMLIKEWWNGGALGRSCVKDCYSDPITETFFLQNDYANVCLTDSPVFGTSTSGDPYISAVVLSQALTFTQVFDNSTCLNDTATSPCSCKGDALYYNSNLNSSWCWCYPGYAGQNCETYVVDEEAFKYKQRKIIELIENPESQLANDVAINTFERMSLVPADLTVIKKIMDQLRIQALYADTMNDAMVMINAFGNIIVHAINDFEQQSFNHLNEYISALTQIEEEYKKGKVNLTDDEAAAEFWARFNESTSKQETFQELAEEAGLNDYSNDSYFQDGWLDRSQGDGSYYWPSYKNVEDVLSTIAIRTAYLSLDILDPAIGHSMIMANASYNLQNITVAVVMNGDSVPVDNIAWELCTVYYWQDRAMISFDNNLVNQNFTYTVAATLSMVNDWIMVDTDSLKDTTSAGVNASDYMQASCLIAVVANHMLLEYTVTQFDNPLTIDFHSNWDYSTNATYYCLVYNEDKDTWVYDANVAVLKSTDSVTMMFTCEVKQSGTYAIFADQELSYYGIWAPEPSGGGGGGSGNNSGNGTINAASLQVQVSGVVFTFLSILYLLLN